MLVAACGTAETNEHQQQLACDVRSEFIAIGKSGGGVFGQTHRYGRVVVTWALHFLVS